MLAIVCLLIDLHFPKFSPLKTLCRLKSYFIWLGLYYRQSYVGNSLSFNRFTLSKVFSSENTVSIEVIFHIVELIL